MPGVQKLRQHFFPPKSKSNLLVYSLPSYVYGCVTAVSDEFPIILGGDHSIVLGSLAGMAAACNKKGKRLGVLYVDAHGDFNTCDTTLSGNIHGMCLSGSCGYGIPELTDLYFKGRKVDLEAKNRAECQKSSKSS